MIVPRALLISIFWGLMTAIARWRHLGTAVATVNGDARIS
jgi:hypothetical protein